MEKISSFKGTNRFLSNFYYAPIPYRDFMCDSVEVAYQAEKCDNYEDLVMIAHMNSMDAKLCGKRIKIRPDWEEDKLMVMEILCRRKFDKYIGLQAMLLGTKDKILEEGNTWGDIYWGICNGAGENHLGKILMQLRKEYRD